MFEVKFNDEKIFEVNDAQEKVLKYWIDADNFEDDIKRRLFWVINELYKESVKQMKQDWIPELMKQGVENVPLNDQKLAELIMGQKDYADRKARRVKEDAIKKS